MSPPREPLIKDRKIAHKVARWYGIEHPLCFYVNPNISPRSKFLLVGRWKNVTCVYCQMAKSDGTPDGYGSGLRIIPT